MNVMKSRDSSLGGNAEMEKEKIVKKIEIRDQIVVTTPGGGKKKGMG